MAVWSSGAGATPADIQNIQNILVRQHKTLETIQESLQQLLAARRETNDALVTLNRTLNKFVENETGADSLLLNALVNMDKNSIE